MLILAQQSDSLASTAMFYAFAAMAALSAIGLTITGNIVRMAVYLLFTLAGVAGLYFLLQAEFLAAVQLVVYAGGTLILIVFGVMLTSKSPFVRFEAKRGEVLVAVGIGAVMLTALLAGLLSAWRANAFGKDELPVADNYPMQQLGQALLGDYLIPFEVASVLLLVVMIGAAYLAKARKRKT